MEQQNLEIHGREIREHILPLPTPAHDYVRVLLVGTTGAGKTTLVRQLLGTHPQTERFPSTSAGKTTTAEFEAILREEPFEAIITFFSKQEVQICTEECVLAAAQMYLEERGDESAARKLLEHEEQRFRLRYILGEFPVRRNRREQPSNDTVQGEVVTEEIQRFANTINQYLDTIRSLVNTFRENPEVEVDSLGENASVEDYDLYLWERLEQELHQQAAFQNLINDIVEAVEQRFDLLTSGKIIRGQESWPLYWTFQTTDRQQFLDTVNTFSSNHSSRFGKLLTPLVQGIRIAGPFHPEWWSESAPHLVLIDGEGLGHTPDTAASVSTRITGLFEEADVILLVDNAKQPMQAAPQSVLEAVVTSGFASKLLICFTHFEDVDGDSLPDRSAREDHVRSSLDNVIAGVGKKVGMRDKHALRQSLEGRVFFLSHLQHWLTLKTQATVNEPELPQTREELRKMLALLQVTSSLPTSNEIRPVYDERSLFPHIQKAVEAFREKWRRLLGPTSERGEHWTRIKALARRPAFLGEDEYDTLRPVADLIREMSEHLKQFLEKPMRWEPANQATEEKRQAIIDSIARELHSQLHKLIRKRLVSDPCLVWRIAFERQGRGSAKVRACDIDGVYGTVAPTFSEIVQGLDFEQIYPSVVATLAEVVEQGEDEFTVQITEIVRLAIQASNGKMIKG